MIFDGFEIHFFERITDANCECGNRLTEVSNGWISAALFCTKCENVYILKKIKLPKKKITKEFLTQCRFEIEFDKQKFELRKQLEKSFKK